MSSRVAPVLTYFRFYSIPMYGKTYRSVSIVLTEFGNGGYLTNSNTPQSLRRVSGQTSAEYAGKKPQGRKTSSLRIRCHMVDPPIEATLEAQCAGRSIYNHQDGLDPEYTCLSPLYSASCIRKLIWVCVCLNPTNHQAFWATLFAIHNCDVSVALFSSLSLFQMPDGVSKSYSLIIATSNRRWGSKSYRTFCHNCVSSKKGGPVNTLCLPLSCTLETDLAIDLHRYSNFAMKRGKMFLLSDPPQREK